MIQAITRVWEISPSGNGMFVFAYFKRESVAAI